MKTPTTLALFVLAASLVNATENYSVPDFAWDASFSDQSIIAGPVFDAAGSLVVFPPPDLPQPDLMEVTGTNVVKYNLVKDNLDADPGASTPVWIELFHQR